MTTSTMSMPAPRRRRPSIALPLLLIAIGLALLLMNLGYLHGFAWAELSRVWPVLFIVLGVDLLLRPRSYLAAAVVEVLIVVATFAYLVSTATVGPASGLTYSANVPREGASDLALVVNYGGGELALSGGAADLVTIGSTTEDVASTVARNGSRADVTLSSRAEGSVFSGRDRRWDVRVPSDVPTAMTLNLGAGEFDVDLSQVQISRATLNAGASDLSVRFGAPKGDVRVTISAGASDVKIYVPAGVAYRVETSGVLHDVSGATSSSDYGTAADRLTIRVSVAMGAVSIR